MSFNNGPEHHKHDDKALTAADSFIKRERMANDPNIHSLATRHAEEARKKLSRFLSS